MANCPKCGKKLHIYNVSQFCPECGTNMTFYGFAETFIKEAKMAELSQANVHVKVKRLKAAYIGSKLAIARLVVMLLPAVAFLIPAGSFGLNIPFAGDNFDFSGLGIYNLFNAGGLDYLLSLISSPFAGADAKALMIALAVYALAALTAVVILLLSLLCFISYKNMQKITAVASAIGLVETVATIVLFKGFVSDVTSGLGDKTSGLFTATFSGIGLFVLLLMFAVVFAVNLLLWIKGIPVEYGEGMEERTEIYKKVKNGTINVDDLPQPVVETEETRKIEEAIKKEEEAQRAKANNKAEEVVNNG